MVIVLKLCQKYNNSCDLIKLVEKRNKIRLVFCVQLDFVAFPITGTSIESVDVSLLLNFLISMSRFY
ncbi:hypothetical protein BpHYR1_017833 [Brachionus plicatilis]|uniref:Uncharacterized protein n=1 Tax=Brachionus plicatilis TaxID=10195 RepID=A0A3M7Q1R1_BRAPC|nr:hypothetical protein BpHYR1_017833 [Brachionus plicatilis]